MSSILACGTSLQDLSMDRSGSKCLFIQSIITVFVDEIHDPNSVKSAIISGLQKRGVQIN